jgi:hypothetical protein
LKVAMTPTQVVDRLKVAFSLTVAVLPTER